MPDIAKSDISPNLDRDKMFNELWWLNYCFCEGVGIGAVGNPFFGGEAVNICLHSKCEMTDIGDPFCSNIRVCLCLTDQCSLPPAPGSPICVCFNKKLAGDDGWSGQQLFEIGLPALVIPFGSTTSSALASASLPHKPMAVLSLPSRQRSCASRLEPNWPPQWKVASCVPQWALACASGTSVLCHQLRVLPCSLVSICWTRRAPPPSHWHMDPEISWAKSARQMLMFCYDTVNSLAAPKFLNTVFSSLLRICLLPAKETEWVMKHRCIAFCLWLEPCRTSQDGRKKSWRFKMSTCDSMVIICDMCLYCACFLRCIVPVLCLFFYAVERDVNIDVWESVGKHWPGPQQS